MAHYQPLCDKLKDSTPTQKFIKLLFKLIKAMSSRIPRDALYAKDDCRNKQVRIIIEHNNNNTIFLSLYIYRQRFIVWS